MTNPVIIGDATLYLGDCRKLLREIGGYDVVIGDPPYPRLQYGWEVVSPLELPLPDCQQFWFWMNPPEAFPAPFTAMHIWSKANVYIGDCELWESIYELNGRKVSSVLRESAINSEMSAQMNGDTLYDHPTQKPLKLMTRLVQRTRGVVLDPFMGSGTTGVACMKLGRPFIGMEQNGMFFELACRRIEAAYAQPDMFVAPPAKPVQEAML